MNIERLQARISAVPLFSALGAAINDSSISRIWSWDEWPGPEDPRVEDIGTRMQRMYDELANLDEKQEWNRTIDLIVKSAAPFVPYIDGQDAWYAPNTAA